MKKKLLFMVLSGMAFALFNVSAMKKNPKKVAPVPSTEEVEFDEQALLEQIKDIKLFSPAFAIKNGPFCSIIEQILFSHEEEKDKFQGLVYIISESFKTFLGMGLAVYSSWYTGLMYEIENIHFNAKQSDYEKEIALLCYAYAVASAGGYAEAFEKNIQDEMQQQQQKEQKVVAKGKKN